MYMGRKNFVVNIKVAKKEWRQLNKDFKKAEETNYDIGRGKAQSGGRNACFNSMIKSTPLPANSHKSHGPKC